MPTGTSHFIRRSNNSSNKLSQYEHSKKSQQKSSSRLCLMLLSIAFIAALYLIYAAHISDTAGIGNELRSRLSSISAINSIYSFPHKDTIFVDKSEKEKKENERIKNNLTLKPLTIPKYELKVSVQSPSTLSINQRCQNRRSRPILALPSNRTAPGGSNLHFIHIPKCGGTSMTAVLREMVCNMNPEKNIDCCTNPGFCDWHAFRRCSVIKGCTDHFPNRAWIYKPMPSVALFRNPTSRLLSAWFYRGHSPNLDFFQVRPWFKEIQLGLRPKVVFDEYIYMTEYQNIQTRMLGADSFPYRNITITEDIFCKAVDALDNLFFVGLQEAYDISVQAILREFRMDMKVEVKKERDQGAAPQIAAQKEALKNNATLMALVKDINHYDYALYMLAVERFCEMIRKYDDLYLKLQETTKVRCPGATS